MRSSPGTSEDRSGVGAEKVGIDAEVAGNPVKDLVDVERPDRLLEVGRAPPMVPLERMVAQIDYPLSAGQGRKCFLVDAAGEPWDPFGKAGLGDRSRHQPGLVTGTPTLGNQSLDDRERHHQVPEPEGDRCHVDPGHLVSGPA